MNIRLWTIVLAATLYAGHMLNAGQAPAAMVEVTAWRIKPGGKKPNDYWVDGVVRNVSKLRLTEVTIRFDIVTGSGVSLGESDASIKLSTLLPDQTCLFAAPVEIHDKRMRKMVLIGVKIATADDLLIFKDVPFAASRRSSLFRNARRDPPSRH